MKLISVDSNMVDAIGYDPDNYLLQVVFSGGKVYLYEEVPPEVFEDLMYTESVGNYLLEYVMDVYNEQEVS